MLFILGVSTRIYLKVILLLNREGTHCKFAKLLTFLLIKTYIMSTTEEANFEKTLEDLKATLDQSIPELNKMGVAFSGNSIAEGEPSNLSARRAANPITVETKWWGIDIILNEKVTADLIAGVTGSGVVAGFVAKALGFAGVITGGAATVIGAGIAAIFAIKIAQMKIVNRGNGVHFPITWLQWAAIVAALPAGPAGILAAGAVFIHPIPN